MAQHDLRRVERAAVKLKESRVELRQAIRLAHASGETYADIGRSAGLTAERVRQIANES